MPSIRIQTTSRAQVAKSPYGPVPATVKFPKEKAPKGTRYCEEVDAYVPAALTYRARGIKIQRKKTLVQRIAKAVKKTDDNEEEPIVLAMGLTHAKMHLVPLAVAQQNNAIRYHGLDDEEPIDHEARYGIKLLSLYEAQTDKNVVYRGFALQEAQRR